VVSCSRCVLITFHVEAGFSFESGMLDPKPDANLPEEERMKRVRELRAKMLVEKKTVINLLGAYAVALKHYLRGEDGIYYE
jgi:hypothetical protein